MILAHAIATKLKFNYYKFRIAQTKFYSFFDQSYLSTYLKAIGYKFLKFKNYNVFNPQNN